jgi:hypothetical protein
LILNHHAVSQPSRQSAPKLGGALKAALPACEEPKAGDVRTLANVLKESGCRQAITAARGFEPFAKYKSPTSRVSGRSRV